VNSFLSVVRTPNVQLVDHRADVTGAFYNQQNVISGRVANSGEGESGPVAIGITITDPSNNILYTDELGP
jgi:hypothetical protein